MKTMMKKMFLTVCSFILIAGVFSKKVDANEQVDDYQIIKDIVLEELIKNYSEYYDVTSHNIEIYETDIKGNKADIYLFASLDTILKAKNVSELPYIEGMLEEVNISAAEKNSLDTEVAITNAIKINNSNRLSNSQIAAIANQISETSNLVEQYIGTVSDTNFYLKVTVDINNGIVVPDTIQIFVEDIAGNYEPVENAYPKSREQMKNEGAEVVQYCIENPERIAVRASNSALAARSTSSVSYMLQYTSNPTTCEIDGASCTSKQDSSKWNNESYPYSSTYAHNDCADYVSQALYESGIPLSGNWQIRSSTWNTVSGLVDHMVNRGIFVEATSTEPITAGSVVRMGSGHIVMITYADTVSLKYSGHTHDRKNVTYYKGSGYTEYNLW